MEKRTLFKNVMDYKIYAPEIAKGDFSKVYLAHGKDPKNIIVIKAFELQWITDNWHLFETEIVAHMEHSGQGITPKVVDNYLKSASSIYLPIDFCNCGSLDIYIKMFKGFPEKTLLDVAKFMAKSLAHLHGKSIIHREVNPKHILAHMESDGRITYQLVGFQFSKNIKTGSTSSFVGTPAYSAPETVKEQPYDYSADIWSLGVSLYELAVGLLPQKVDPDFVAHMKKEMPIMYPASSDLSPGLQNLIKKCLAFNPKSRITAKQFLDHPWIKGQEFALAPGQLPESVIPDPAKKKPAKPPPPLSTEEQLRLVTEDFAKYMEYWSQQERSDVTLKAVKRTNLKPYEIIQDEPLGAGGFGEIYLCQNTETKVKYALKIVKVEKIKDVKTANLLLGEIEIMLTLKNSPFTIYVEDYFFYKNSLCLILELCNGGDLDSYVRRKIRDTKKPLPIEELRLIAWNVACGLREIHSKNMMHRDIKPKNILTIVDDKRDLLDIKLCDYGLGKKGKVKELQVAGNTIVGTFDYFAPELFIIIEKMMVGETEGLAYDNKVDVWAYGMSLYFAAFGRALNETPGAMKLLMGKNQLFIPNVPGIPDSFIILMKLCLEVNSAKRPSFDEVLKNPFFEEVSIPLKPDILPYIDMGKISANVIKVKRGMDIYAIKLTSLAKLKVERLKYEISTMLKLLNSKYVIRLIDYFLVLDKYLAIVTNYYEDGTLMDYLRQKSSEILPEDQISQIAFFIISGMRDIHSHNVIHRDIHPKNIYVKVQGGKIIITAIAEFGLSKVVLPEEITATELGTYKSPEIIDERSYDCKTDIWSFGILLYVMMFGKEPHEVKANTPAELFKKGNIHYDEKRASKYPKMVNIMKMCLKVDPKDRKSAEELLKEDVFLTFNAKK